MSSKHSQSNPYFKVYGVEKGVNELLYTTPRSHTLLYTSEVVRGCVNSVEWKPAVFGVPKGYNLKKFKVEIFDKEVIGKDLLLAGPVNVQYFFG